MQISIDAASKKSRRVFKRGICGNQTLAWEDAGLMLVTGLSYGKMVAMVIRNQPDHSPARSSATKLELPLPPPTNHHHHYCVQAG